MFNHDYGVALVSEMLERREKVLVITRVQADTWLIKNVDDSSQARPDLTGQPNPLRLTSGQCGLRFDLR